MYFIMTLNENKMTKDIDVMNFYVRSKLIEKLKLLSAAEGFVLQSFHFTAIKINLDFYICNKLCLKTKKNQKLFFCY